MVESDVRVGYTIGSYCDRMLSRVDVLLVIALVETKLRFFVGRWAYGPAYISDFRSFLRRHAVA